jgi:hypothetical protein
MMPNSLVASSADVIEMGFSAAARKLMRVALGHGCRELHL